MRYSEKDVEKQIKNVKLRFRIIPEVTSQGTIEGVLEVVNNNPFPVIVTIYKLVEDYGELKLNSFPVYLVRGNSSTTIRQDTRGVLKVARPSVQFYNQGFGTFAVAVTISAYHFEAERVIRIENKRHRKCKNN